MPPSGRAGSLSRHPVGVQAGRRGSTCRRERQDHDLVQTAAGVAHIHGVGPRRERVSQAKRSRRAEGVTRRGSLRPWARRPVPRAPIIPFSSASSRPDSAESRPGRRSRPQAPGFELTVSPGVTGIRSAGEFHPGGRGATLEPRCDLRRRSPAIDPGRPRLVQLPAPVDEAQRDQADWIVSDPLMRTRCRERRGRIARPMLGRSLHAARATR